MSEEQLNLIREAYAAFRRRDIAGILARLHPEIEIYQSETLPWGGRYRGQAQVQEYFHKIDEQLDTAVQPEEIFEAGDHVVVLGRTQGRARSSGQPFAVRIVHLWTFRAGQVVRFEAYIDTPAMLQALGA
jgi:ketosteroid isomerase-like protein